MDIFEYASGFDHQTGQAFTNQLAILVCLLRATWQQRKRESL